jgi:hypothetical protein
MWLMKFSRSLAQLLLLAIIAPIAIWQVEAGHRWAPFLLFLAFLAAGAVIRRVIPRA